MINRTAFLLNYLSDKIDGAQSYSHWINGDLYETTTEQFGICQFPESLRTRLSMEPYSETVAKRFKLNANDDWLRKRQGLALPALPPTTQEARQYFFTKIRDFTQSATADGKKHINYEAFAQEWNRTADGKDRFYVTFEVLAAYAKGWEKTSNVRATQEIMAEQIEEIKTSTQIFARGSGPFPSYTTSTPTQTYPSHGVVELVESADVDVIPSSLTTNPAKSRGTDLLLHHDPTPTTQRIGVNGRSTIPLVSTATSESTSSRQNAPVDEANLPVMPTALPDSELRPHVNLDPISRSQSQASE